MGVVQNALKHTDARRRITIGIGRSGPISHCTFGKDTHILRDTIMTSKTNVSLVYYTGAGASNKPLPLVSKTPARMRKLAEELRTDDYQERVGPTQRGTLEQLGERLECLAERADSCPSIDVLARLHHLRREQEELRTLKTTLSAFFMLEEGRQLADPRYGHFFAYMADRDARNAVAMPTDVRVISWNYDHQFEKSFAEFIPESQDGGRRATGRRLQVVPPLTPDECDPRAFSILKLNGAAGARASPSTDSRPTHNPDLYDQPSDPGRSLFLALRFCENVAAEDPEPYLQFAWEDDRRRSGVLELIDGFGPVETVVVIGYSFPLFNRDLDRRILDTLRPSDVFLQVAGDNNVRDRIVGLGVDSEKITIVEDREQFFIPHTYSPSERKLPHQASAR